MRHFLGKVGTRSNSPSFFAENGRLTVEIWGRKSEADPQDVLLYLCDFEAICRRNGCHERGDAILDTIQALRKAFDLGTGPLERPNPKEKTP